MSFRYCPHECVSMFGRNFEAGRKERMGRVVFRVLAGKRILVSISLDPHCS